MGQFTQDGVIYEEVGNGQVRVVGYEDAPATPAPIITGRQSTPVPPGYEADGSGGMRPVSGGPADPAVVAALDAARRDPPRNTDQTSATALSIQNQQQGDQRRAGVVRDLMANVRGLYNRNLRGQPLSRMFGATEYIDSWPNNEEFSAAARAILPLIRPLISQTAKEGDSDREMEVFMAYIPSNNDSDQTIEQKLNMLETLIGGMVDGMPPSSTLGSSNRTNQAAIPAIGAPPMNGGANPGGPNAGPPAGPNIPRAAGAHQQPGVNVAGVTGEGGMRGLPELASLPNEIASLVGQGATEDQVMAHISQRFAGASVTGINPEVHRPMMRYLVNSHRANPSTPVRSMVQGWDNLAMVPAGSGGMLGRIADTPVGSAIISAANGVSAGNLGNVAGDNARSVIDYSRQENPVSSFIGDASGTALAMAALSSGAPMLGVAGRGLTAMGGLGGDAAYGGIRGYSETGTPEGALLGAGAGVVGNRAGSVLGRGGAAALATRPGQFTARQFLRAGNSVRNAGRGMFGRNPLPTPDFNPPQRLSAAETVLGNAAQDNIPTTVQSNMDTARALDLPYTLADATPEYRSIAGAAFRRSSGNSRNAAEDFIMQRSRGQADRANSQIISSFGPIANPNEQSAALMNMARRQSAPLYEQAFSAPGRTSPTLEALMQTPAGQRAVAEARNIAANEGVPPTSMGFDLDAQGNVQIVQNPSLRTMDYVKRALDDQLSAYRNPITGGLDLNDAGRSVEGVRRNLVAELDNLYPDYQAARQAFAGPASAREAMQAGRSTTNMQPRDIQMQMDRLPPANQAQYQLGARIGLSDAVDRVRFSGNPYESIYGSPVAQNRLETLFPGQTGDFANAYRLEGDMGRTATELVGGSQTASRLAAQQSFDQNIAGDIVNAGVDTALTGTPVRAAWRIPAWLTDNVVSRARERKANDVLELLLNPNTNPLPDILARRSSRRNYINNGARRGGMFGGAAGVSMLPVLASE